MIFDNYNRKPIEFDALDKNCDIQKVQGTILIKGKSVPSIENKTSKKVEGLLIQKFNKLPFNNLLTKMVDFYYYYMGIYYRENIRFYNGILQ